MSNVPENAKAQTADGAVAFTKFFADQTNAAYETLQPELITQLSLPSCQSCQAMVDSISGWRTSSQRYVGRFLNPTQVSIAAFPGDGTAKVLLSTKTEGAKLVDAQGSTVSTFPGESGNLSYALQFGAGSWRVAAIRVAG